MVGLAALPSVGVIDRVEHVSGLVPPWAGDSGGLRLQADLDRHRDWHGTSVLGVLLSLQRRLLQWTETGVIFQDL